MKLLAIFLILACGSNLGSAVERDAAITENELVRRTQELYDAIVPGDQAPWKRYFADDSIFADEKGRTMDKAKLIADITPLPAGYSGAIKFEHVQSRIYDNVAILSYDINETEPMKFPDFIGSYELAPGQTRTVVAAGDSLFVERNGKKEQLFPETSELFFRKGIEGRILFRYDKDRKVDALIDRRNNEDVIWRKAANK